MRELSSVHVSQLGFGGALNAAKRISEAINDNGPSAELEYEVPEGKSGRINGTRLMSKIDHEIQNISPAEITTSILRSSANSNWLKEIIIKHKSKEIWNLHWMPGLPNQTLIDLVEEKNVVWTLHDSNPYTGICHNSGECDHYKSDCNNCPQIFRYLNSVPKLVLNRKLQMVDRAKNLVFVAPSVWIMREFQSSSIGQIAQVVNIPNPIPDLFFMDKPKIQSEITTVTLLGSDYSKSKNSYLAALGLKRFIESNPNARIRIQIIGKEFQILKPNEQICLPPSSSQFELANFLKKSDVLIYTSQFDNLPNLVLEAQAAGNFVLGLNTGGVSECYIDQKTGFTVMANPDHISKALELLMENGGSLLSKSQNSTQYIRDNFSYVQVSKRYLDLYSHMTSNK